MPTPLERAIEKMFDIYFYGETSEISFTKDELNVVVSACKAMKIFSEIVDMEKKN